MPGPSGCSDTPPKRRSAGGPVIIPPDRLDEERQILERLGQGERVEHFETVRVAKGGRPIDISLTISPVRDRDGRVVGASKVRDVTQRKHADAALRESEGWSARWSRPPRTSSTG